MLEVIGTRRRPRRRGRRVGRDVRGNERVWWGCRRRCRVAPAPRDIGRVVNWPVSASEHLFRDETAALSRPAAVGGALIGPRHLRVHDGRVVHFDRRERRGPAKLDPAPEWRVFVAAWKGWGYQEGVHATGLPQPGSRMKNRGEKWWPSLHGASIPWPYATICACFRIRVG